MNVYEAIMTRRSTRRFQKRMPDEETIMKIVEAGRYAPSGGNSQTSRFFIIRDKEVLDQLAGMAKDAFAKMEVTEGMYPSLVSSITRSKSGAYRFHYDAPVLIVLANKKDYGNNIADCACALENMMILANEMDLGSCWINQLKWLNEDAGLLAYFQSMGLDEDERIYGALALGYADSESGLPERKALPRKGNPVVMIG
ncbi:MAG: nitroreductase [Solobacterium sp.]|nr:nitroreductase [Solobacterium sp.]